MLRGSSLVSARVTSPRARNHYQGHWTPWCVRWNNCKPPGMSREGEDMWHLRRITTTPTNFVRAHRHPLRYSACDLPGMPQIYPCGISGESQLPQEVYSSNIDVTQSRMHARNASRRRRALRPQDAGTGATRVAGVAHYARKMQGQGHRSKKWRSRFTQKNAKNLPDDALPNTCFQYFVFSVLF